jgi:hypothetical protein
VFQYEGPCRAAVLVGGVRLFGLSSGCVEARERANQEQAGEEEAEVTGHCHSCSVIHWSTFMAWSR